MSFLSVVVATYKRADVIRVTLEHLNNQTLSCDKYEVIVVDDGSPDETETEVRRFEDEAKFKLTYLRHENSGPGFTENRGIRHARGPWILLIADDIQPLPDMLESHYQAHCDHPENNVAVAGKVVQSPDLPKTVFLKHWNPFRYDSFGEPKELSYINFWACNVSFKKDFMIEYGMFLERPGAAHEDTELGWRLYKNGGMRLLYRRDALAHHYHVEDVDSASRRAFERGLNFDVLADRVNDPGLYIRSHILTRKTFPLLFGGFKRSEASVLPEDQSPVIFFLREAVRKFVFNRVTVPYFFMPLIRRSESSTICAMFMSTLLLRAVNGYHFLRGVSELRRRRAADSTSTQPLPV